MFLGGPLLISTLFHHFDPTLFLSCGSEATKSPEDPSQIPGVAVKLG
jgi:hypothetical protein